MNQEIKEKWVKALRSGRYRQAHGVLSNETLDGREVNCCLGVLCRVARLRDREWRTALMLRGFEAGEELMACVGLRYEQEGKLANLNDEEGKSFSEIADYIEKNV